MTATLQRIKVCLEQKNIFMTNIINVTNQIIVLSNQPIVNLEGLLESRQENMDRIDKCNVLIKTSTDNLEGTEKALIFDLFEKKQPENVTEDSTIISDLVEKYEELLTVAIELDKKGKTIFNQSFSEIKKKLSLLRRKEPLSQPKNFFQQ